MHRFHKRSRIKCVDYNKVGHSRRIPRGNEEKKLRFKVTAAREKETGR